MQGYTKTIFIAFNKMLQNQIQNIYENKKTRIRKSKTRFSKRKHQKFDLKMRGMVVD